MTESQPTKTTEATISAINESRDTTPQPSLKTYLGIFFTSSAVLLFELVLTRIFAVILWAHLAFMVVGTALFGFGLSGVYLALRKSQKRFTLPTLCIAISLAMLLAFQVILYVPFKMWQQGDMLNYLYLAIWYVALLIPFFFAGLTIAELLGNFPKASNRLYGVDLLGAACGSLALVPLLPLMTAEGTLVLSAVLACVAGLLFSSKGQKTQQLVLVALIVIFAVVSAHASSWMPVTLHQAKRQFKSAVEKGLILATRWSAISRVDIAESGTKKNRRVVWIDGGTNHSGMIKVDGSIDNLPALKKRSIGVTYDLKEGTYPNVLIIGSSGGQEVLYALSNGAKNVDAVEMDPSIAKFVTDPRFTPFMGNLFENRRVNFVNDEGRAYMRRKPYGTYDVIQFVNNYTPAAIAAGALNLSETFLITKEAFIDYYNHLSDNGILALHRGATLRVAITAIAALRELGVQNPEQHILIANGEWDTIEGFFLKKTPWKQEEVNQASTFLRKILAPGRDPIIWNPLSPAQDNIYARLLKLSEDKQKEYYTSLGINLFPATDDRPFVEHYLQFGKVHLDNNIPNEFRRFNNEKWNGIIPRGDFPYVIILAESALLALLFVGAPLVLWARSSFKTRGFLGVIGFFAALGFGFIIVEICLMKRYVLFLGNPIYSVTTILVVLLLGAGIGSITVERFDKYNLKTTLTAVLGAVAAALLLETLLSPVLFAKFLYLDFPGRVFVSSLMLLPLGFVMGMPFALGLRLINRIQKSEEERRKLIAWAWGVNGYTTVIGSAATVFIALYFGFKVALIVAIVSYLLGLAAARSAFAKLGS